MIVIDIGNSNIKCFEVFNIDNIKLIFNIKAQKHLLESRLSVIDKDDIYVVSTNRDFEEFIISHRLNSVSVQSFEKNTNFLAPYEGYGIDRLINAFAASKLYGENILLVSMGSAITYDIIKSSKIQYGYITLGLSHRFECLFSHIPHLNQGGFDLSDIDLSKPTSNTKEAITIGTMLEIINNINMIKQKEGLDVLLTGGDAKHFSHMFNVDFEILPKGVFLAFKNF